MAPAILNAASPPPTRSLTLLPRTRLTLPPRPTIPPRPVVPPRPTLPPPHPRILYQLTHLRLTAVATRTRFLAVRVIQTQVIQTLTFLVRVVEISGGPSSNRTSTSSTARPSSSELPTAQLNGVAGWKGVSSWFGLVPFLVLIGAVPC